MTLGLEKLIGAAEGYRLMEPVATNDSCHSEAEADVVIYMGESTADTMPVAKLASAIPVLVIADGPHLADADSYLRAGAVGYLHNSAPLATVLDAVRYVAERRRTIYIPFAGLDGVEDGEDNQALSPRERQVLEHIALGRTHDQTARSLGLSRHTVDTYVKRARRKLSAGNKADLVRAVMAFG